MIRAKTVTCGVCQSYYSDPRQIPCSHSFCFDCILGRFDEETLILVCPDCQKAHQYKSMEEFQSRCMRNAVLATMVAQYKKNQSRSSNTTSRPTSTIPHMSPVSSSTPIPTQFSSMINGLYSNSSTSERSSPATQIGIGRPSPVTTTSSTSTSVFIAKCQLCCVKTELSLCKHCDSVICEKCAYEHQHQNPINQRVQSDWQICKTKFEEIHEKSIRFDNDREEMTSRAHDLQKLINDKANEMIRTIENQKRNYFELMDKQKKTNKTIDTEDLTDEYESIDKRVTECLRSNDVNADKINDFLFEIEHIENRLDELNNFVHSHELKFPVLSFQNDVDVSSLLGSLEFLSSTNQNDRSNPYACSTTAAAPKVENRPKMTTELSEIDDDDNEEPFNSHFTRPMDLSHSSTKSESRLSPLASGTPTRKRSIWTIDYFSVPYYVRTYGNHLFVCDKYGSLAVYRFNKTNDMRQKPDRILQIRLFKENGSSNSDEDQMIIDSFVVYKLWIIVFKRKKNELIGTIHLFTHEGKPVVNGRCPHNYPSRELTIDTEKNLLWSLDQKQLTLFCYDLPENRVNNPEETFKYRQAHVQLTKPFAPIHISVNRKFLAVLDKNRGAVHVFDKETKRQTFEYLNSHHRDTHGCWDMALFSDNSLLIKLDETSTLKTGPSKHIYLQLDDTPQHNVIGFIEETDAYGMMITTNDEILIGVRVNTKGIVKCYV